ncbi:MAG TPA: hypothetical protein VMW47_11000 [Verrucomicrobiae bacterium]|nr:hypothetical protein [Verrucomicrobiae bacterium]
MRRGAVGILVAATIGLALLPAAAAAFGSRELTTSARVATSFCGRIPLARVSAVVGHPVSLLPEVSGRSSLCIYRWGTGAAAFEHEVTISRVTNTVSKVSSQELEIARQYAKQHAHCAFSRLPSLGADGFGFRCAYAVFTLSGVGALRGTTGFSAVTLGALSVSKEEQLLRLGFAAG